MPRARKPRRLRLSRAKGWRLPDQAVNCARPGPYGNPFSVRTLFARGFDGDERQAAHVVVAAHRAWMRGERHWFHDGHILKPPPPLAPLRRRDLYCWCREDDPCHADTLLVLANPRRPKC